MNLRETRSLRTYPKVLDRFWKGVVAGERQTDITSCQIEDLQETVPCRGRIHHCFLESENEIRAPY